MNAEGWYESIERDMAGWAEERRKDREENRQIWRDTQRQINELSVRVNDLTVKIAETNHAISRLADETNKKITLLAEESRAADGQLGERIEALVSAMDQFLTKQPGG
ncbi:MAG: hypothetical protein ABSH50_08070 [Bryobacteraceae bacterium]|jgi:hypothetical protein